MVCNVKRKSHAGPRKVETCQVFSFEIVHSTDSSARHDTTQRERRDGIEDIGVEIYERPSSSWESAEKMEACGSDFRGAKDHFPKTIAVALPRKSRCRKENVSEEQERERERETGDDVV